MFQIEIFPNVLAMICTLIAVIMLIKIALKMGGILGEMLKYISAGLFFSILVHSFAELLNVFGLLDEKILLPLMGILLTLGSLLFIWASIIGAELFKE